MQDDPKNKEQMLKHMMSGAFVLTIAAFVSKLLSALYKVPFQNLTGNEGFYVYQQVYPLYGLALALSLNGLPIFISKVVAEQESKDQQMEVVKRVTMMISFLSFCLFLLIYGSADHLAVWMGDPLLAPMIRTVSWMYLCLPVLSALRGFFQGNLQMLPTALSQVSEQLVRVVIILSAAFSFHQNGGTVYQMGARAFRSSWMSALVASSVLVLFWIRYTRRSSVSHLIEEEKLPDYRTLAKRLATEGFTISMVGSLIVLFQLVDSFTVYNGLLKLGQLKETAMEAKGIYDRGQPLVQLGMVTAVGLASGSLPLLRMQHAQGRQQLFLRTSRSMMRLTAVFAGAASAGLIAIMPYLNKTLFEDQAGTNVLQVFVLSVLGISLVSSYHSILQSTDGHRLAFWGTLLSVGLKGIGTVILVSLFGLIGASLATVGALFFMYAFLRYFSPLHLHSVRFEADFILRLFGALLGMVVAVRASMFLFAYFLPNFGQGRTGALLYTLVGVIIGSITFVRLVLRLNVLTIREWLSIPFGKQLLRGRRK